MHGNARFFCQHPVHGFKPGAFGEAWPERCLGKASIVPSPSPIPNLKVVRLPVRLVFELWNPVVKYLYPG